MKMAHRQDMRQDITAINRRLDRLTRWLVGILFGMASAQIAILLKILS